jgi:transposase-like protein
MSPTPTTRAPESRSDAPAADLARRVCRLAEDAAATAARDPDATLRVLSDLRRELDAFERATVAAALSAGSSFGAVARALGISRQGAHRRYRDLAPGDDQPLGLSSPARRALLLAREESASAPPRSEHLLLGVLRAGGRVCRALEAEGITAAAVRECLGEARDGEPPARDVARSILADAAGIARARRAACVDTDHVVLATLNAPDGGALRAVTALGVTAAAVRDRLGC